MREEIAKLPDYKSHKTVKAALIDDIIRGPQPVNKLHLLVDEDIVVIEKVPDWMHRHQPMIGGYFVVYHAGTDREYHSYSPAKEFDEGYSLI